MDDIIVLGMLTQVGGTVEFLLGTTNRMDDIIVLGMLTQVEKELLSSCQELQTEWNDFIVLVLEPF